jgi:hypothetical protein
LEENPAGNTQTAGDIFDDGVRVKSKVKMENQ